MRLVNILKEFIRKNQKVLIISLVVISIFGLLIDLLIYDQRQTTTENQQRTEKQAAVDNLSPDFRDYVPDKGSLIHIALIEHNLNNLTKSKEFRQSLYFALNRSAIAEKFNDTKDAKLQSKPTAVLFTKDFWSNNPKFLPEPYFPLTADSKQLYDEIELTKHGYNFERALECLGKAWDQLSEEEKKQDYVLGINFDIDENLELSIDNLSNLQLIKQEITDNINKLFNDFTKKKQLRSEQLKLQIKERSNDEQGYDVLDKIILKVESYPLNDQNLSDYFCIELLDYHDFIFEQLYNASFRGDEKIQFDFGLIKEYLDKRKKEGLNIDNMPILRGRISEISYDNNDSLLGSYESSFLPIDSEGQWEGTTRSFNSFKWECLQNNDGLFTTFVGNPNFSKISAELKAVKQKTYEEIYEKMFNLMTKEYCCIPVVIIQEVQTEKGSYMKL